MPRGGKREGAGRPKGKRKVRMNYFRKIHPDWCCILDAVLVQLRKEEKHNEQRQNN